MDRRLIVLALGMFALGTDSFVVAGILPVISKDLGLPVVLVGQMVTLYAISYAVLSPVLAALLAHWPRKRLLLGGIAVFTFGNLLTALAGSLPLLLGSRVVAGVGAAMFSPTATSTAALMVAPERRGQALAVVITGLTTATALGSPMGTFISGLGDWRLTMWFVSALGLAALAGVWLLLPQVPSPPAVSLRQRLAPLGDSRVGFTLLTTFCTYAGLFLVYTYVGVSFDRVTHGDGQLLALLLLVWGVAAMAGNLLAGRYTDRIGGRTIINNALCLLLLDFVLLPWSSAHLASALVAMVVWAVCGWGILVPQQHRLLGIFPATGPLLMGLNQAALYLGVSASGVLGAIGITYLDKYHLGWMGAAFLASAALMSELAHRRIAIMRVCATS